MEQTLTKLNNKLEATSLVDFDPMTDHYCSPANSFIPGPSGDLGKLSEYKKPKDDKKKEVVTLFVSNIPSELTEKGLKNIFSLYGEVLRTVIKRSDKDRYGFIDYDNLDNAGIAIHNLHLKKPHGFKVKFSDRDKSAVKKQEEEKEAEPYVVEDIPPKPVQYLYPSKPSDNLERFLKSDFYKSVKDKEGAHDRFIKKITANEAKNENTRITEYKKKIASMTAEELTKPFVFNGLEKYNLCAYCNCPAMYVSDDKTQFFCSLYCQEKKAEAKK